jgi:hypothetical protein
MIRVPPATVHLCLVLRLTLASMAPAAIHLTPDHITPPIRMSNRPGRNNPSALIPPCRGQRFVGKFLWCFRRRGDMPVTRCGPTAAVPAMLRLAADRAARKGSGPSARSGAPLTTHPVTCRMKTMTTPAGGGPTAWTRTMIWGGRWFLDPA